MGNTETIDAYFYQIKAFESEGDLIHGDYIILNQFYIPCENLLYHIHYNSIIIGEKEKNYEEYLKLNNINKEISYEDEQNNIYNLKEVKLKVEFVTKLKEYFELDKQKKKLCDEIMNYK